MLCGIVVDGTVDDDAAVVVVVDAWVVVAGGRLPPVNGVVGMELVLFELTVKTTDLVEFVALAGEGGIAVSVTVTFTLNSPGLVAL